MCLFVETIRIDPRGVQHLEDHNTRLNDTRQHFWPGSERIRLEDWVHPPQGGAGVTKCRVVYGQAGVVEVTYADYVLRPVHSLRLVAVGNEVDYAYKSTDRAVLNRLYAQRGAQDDVLVVKHGRLTDTSIANIALFDGTNWYTPRHPLLKGTRRADLLRQGLMQEADIRLEHLGAYTRIRLFNALIEWGALELPVSAIYGP